jgi:hypothetical protein
MSTPGGGGQSRGITAKPVAPLKGSFPLDHFGECATLMKAYERCMKVRPPSLYLPSFGYTRRGAACESGDLPG